MEEQAVGLLQEALVNELVQVHPLDRGWDLAAVAAIHGRLL
jgi:hypothetical protein